MVLEAVVKDTFVKNNRLIVGAGEIVAGVFIPLPRALDKNETQIKESIRQAAGVKDQDLEDKITGPEQPLERKENVIDSLPASSAATEPEDIELSYGFAEEEFFMRQAYQQTSLDYEKLWYGESNTAAKFAAEEIYSTDSSNDTDSLFISTEEAQESFMELQYGVVLGAVTEVNFIERRKFDLWIKFNTALFKMFESLYAVTSEINYAAPI